MCEDTTNVLAAQTEIGICLRDRSKYPAIKVFASKAGWTQQKFSRYFPADDKEQPTQLSLGAKNTLIRRDVLPEELRSLLLPDDWEAVRVPQGVDVHEVGRIVAELHAIKTAAHHPDSPAGVEISDCEAEKIARKVAELKAVA